MGGLRMIGGNVTTTKKEKKKESPKKGRNRQGGSTTGQKDIDPANQARIEDKLRKIAKEKGEKEPTFSEFGGRAAEVARDEPNQTIAPQEDLQQQSFEQADDDGIIRLGRDHEEEVDRTVTGQIERAKDLPFGLNVLASPITTIALGVTLAGVAGLSIYAGAAAAAQVPSAYITFLKGLTASGRSPITTEFIKTTGFVGATGGRTAYNAANLTTARTLMSKVFSAKTMTLLGAGASAMFLGLWGQAEAGEPISIAMRDVLREAQRTGDYTLYNEAVIARDEITDLSRWEKIILHTPAGVYLGITNKIRGVKAGAAVMDKLALDLEKAGLEGTDANAFWENNRKEKADAEKANVDYYNDERIKYDEFAREADILDRNEDAEFWRNERKKKSEDELKDTKAIGDYWLAYRKLANELSQNNRPSTLDFGLL